MEQVNPKRVLVAVVAACIAGMLVGSAATFAVLQRSVSFPTSGLVVGVNVGVYADSGCTQNLTSISWGSVDPGGSLVRTAYVKNTGNTEVSLSMSTSGWSPAAANGPVSIVWDRTGFSLGPGLSIPAVLTLSASPSAGGMDFNVLITITGSG